MATETCHYVSRDAKSWSADKPFCFDVVDGKKLNLQVIEKTKKLYQNEYSLQQIKCTPSVKPCDQMNFSSKPVTVKPYPEVWPTFSVLQWLPANYEFEIFYREVPAASGATVTGLLHVLDTDIAHTMLFCNQDPMAAGSKCRKDIP